MRWIIDDALKFVQREARRGNFYDGILMDPPSYGRGPGGEVWKLENELYGLVEGLRRGACATTRCSSSSTATRRAFRPAVLSNMLDMTVKPRFGGTRRRRTRSACP